MKKPQVASFQELHTRLKEHAEHQALTSADSKVEYSYADLARRIDHYYERLPQEVSNGNRVCLYAVAPLEWVPLYFAIILRGGIVVPIDTRVSAQMVQEIITLTKPVLCISETNVDDVALPVSTPEHIKQTKSLSPTPPTSRTLDDPAVIVFTSGTWSKPKGVTLSQKNLLTNAYQILALYEHSQDDTSLAVLPLSHAYQQTVGLLVPLIVGSHIVFLETLSSATLKKALNTYHIKTMTVVPRVLQLFHDALIRKLPVWARPLVQACIQGSRVLPHSVCTRLYHLIRKQIGPDLENLIVGGAPLPQALDAFFVGLGFQVVVGYGLSECSPVVSISTSRNRSQGEVGVPVPGIAISFSDQKEIVIHGDNVFLGYWPDYQTPTSFNTEDMGLLCSEGKLYLQGRTKNLIVFQNGDKIFSEDIEHLALSFADVEDACALEFEMNTTPRIVCVVKGSPDPHELLKFLNNQLPLGVRVDRVVLAETFPYTHTLKPDRKALKQLLQNEQANV